MADRLRALAGAAEWALLDIDPADLALLANKLRVRGTKSPLGQRLTLHGWSDEGKIIRMVLNKYLRIPQSGATVAVEERTWHGIALLPDSTDAVEALVNLCGRGGGDVQVYDEVGQVRCICYDLSMVMSRIAVLVDNGDMAGPTDDELQRLHSWSSTEVWWWRYFKTPTVSARAVSTRDLDVIIGAA